jgi:tubulin-folding cofactor B
MFVGLVAELPVGLWIGVKYDQPDGKNDGSVKGVRYFECLDKYGGFVRPDACQCIGIGDFPKGSYAAVCVESKLASRHALIAF